MYLYKAVAPIFRFARGSCGSLIDQNIIGSKVLLRENLFNHVSYLSSLQRHVRNPQDLNKAADYIRNEWKKTGLEVEEQVFNGPPSDINQYRNLIVSFGPKNAERIIVGAHYDSESESKTPGADDNASGIAGIIELSRLLKKQNPKLTKRIDIVAYTNEERPHCTLEYKDHKKYADYMGSAVHAKYLKENNIPVYGAIIFEMIGFYSNEEGSQRFPKHFKHLLKCFYPSKGNFIGVVSDLRNFGFAQIVKSGIKANSRINARALSVPASRLPDISRSDHDSYYRYGFDAVMVTDTADFRNLKYHTSEDIPEILDYSKMAEVVLGTYGAIIGL